MGALVVLTTLFMASCKSGGSSAYTQGGEKPKIDTEAGTVNGHSYNNTDEYCWEVTITAKASYGGASYTDTETTYMWGTEFNLVATMEESMWSIAQSGSYASASYSYKKASAKDYESCDALNKDED